MLPLILWPLDCDKKNNMKMTEIHHGFTTVTMNRSGNCMQEKATPMVTKIQMNYVMKTAIRIIQIMFPC
jgi:hypothetical protein